MKDQRLERVLAVVRAIDVHLEQVVAHANEMIALRGALMALDAHEEHGIGYPGSPSYEDGPEVVR